MTDAARLREENMTTVTTTDQLTLHMRDALRADLHQPGKVAVPTVSVIVPTSGRPEKLAQLLASLAEQTWPRGDMEVIVAQDGDDSTTRAEVQRFMQRSRRHAAWVSHTRHSAAATRNLGAKAARGDYLLFVDDDCTAHPRWAEQAVFTLQYDPSIGAVASRIIGGSTKFFARVHDHARYYPSLQPKPGERGFACGCAFAIRREIFTQLGGFDETIKTGEDEDLGQRMQALGKRTFFQPSSVVFHHHGRDSLRDMVRHAYRWALRGEVDRHLNQSANSTYGRFASPNPWFYLCAAPAIAALVTLRAWRFCWREPRMPIYLPFVFLDKFAWCLGTFQYLRGKERTA